MTTLDPTVARTIDRSHNRKDVDSEDEDALIASLENDTDTLSHLREKRLQQLHTEFQRARSARTSGHGTYTTVTDNPEKSILDLTTSEEKCIVHFFRSDFRRCRIMDGHLGALAERHLEARFVKVDVDLVPFLVERLKIRVLPCVIAFVKGKSVDRVVGFEGVGRGGDDVRTRDLEVRLVGAGVLERVKMEKWEQPVGSEGQVRREHVEDEDWDEYE